MAKEEPVCAPESMGSEDTLFLLYTSGSTGKPKGLVHTQAGYLLYAALTHRVRHHPGEIRGRGWGRLDWGGLNCCCVQEQGQESWHQVGCRGGLAGVGLQGRVSVPVRRAWVLHACLLLILSPSHVC